MLVHDNPPAMIPLESDCIAAVSYNPATRVLSLRFCKGDGIYSFYGVPASCYYGLLEASSPGTYYHLYIKGRYTHPGSGPIQSLKIGRSPFENWQSRTRSPQTNPPRN